MAFKVFISYSTRDLTRTKQVRRLLEGAGAQVFVAEYSVAPGSDLARKIIIAIRYCDEWYLLKLLGMAILPDVLSGDRTGLDE